MLCDECGEPIENGGFVKVGERYLHEDRCEVLCGYCGKHAAKGDRKKIGSQHYHKSRRCREAPAISGKRARIALTLTALGLLWQLRTPLAHLIHPDQDDWPRSAPGPRNDYVYDFKRGLDESLVGTSDRATGWVVSKDCGCVKPRELRLWKGTLL